MPGSPVRSDALRLPLRDDSVDLIVTSPPYWGLRSYRDGDEHYDGQVGSEATPREFLEALWAVMHECWRVLKPSGSVFVNLGDKRAGSGGHNNAGLPGRTIPPPPGVILDEHGHAHPDPLFGIEEGRTADDPNKPARRGRGTRANRAPRVKASRRTGPDVYNKSGQAGDHDVRAKSKLLLPHRFAIGCEDGQADPARIGWIVRQDMVWDKPNGMPESVDDRTRDGHEYWFHLTKEGDYYGSIDPIREKHESPLEERRVGAARINRQPWSSNPKGRMPSSVWRIATQPLIIPDEVIEQRDLPRHFAAFPQEWPRRLITAFCPEGGVVVDPFGGTGTTAGVADVLGRVGISLDLSFDYCRLAAWRLRQSGHFTRSSTAMWAERQGDLFG